MVDGDLFGDSGGDRLFFSEVCGPGEVTLTFSNLNPARVYVVQILHGEPRDCCSGIFASNQFNTRLIGGSYGPVVMVPSFQLGNGVPAESPANSNDLAVVTAEFSGIESFTYVVRGTNGGTRGPSIAGFQLRAVRLVPGASLSVDNGPNNT